MAEYSVLCAVATGKADLVAAAVAKGCEVNETDQEGNSCLHIAVANGSNEILQILLQSGADVAAKNKKGNTAVELAQNAKTIKDLKAKGATMPEIPDNDKNKRLHEYAEKGLTGGVLLVLQAGADVNHKNARSWTALHYTSAHGHEALAQGLLGARADVNATNGYGGTPLHDAAFNNKPEVAKVLSAHGAQVNARDDDGRTALGRASARAMEDARLGRVFGKREVEALLRAGSTATPSEGACRRSHAGDS
jgi:ankyrin repeat protein